MHTMGGRGGISGPLICQTHIPFSKSKNKNDNQHTDENTKPNYFFILLPNKPISFTKNNTTPIFNHTSAKLKTGNLPTLIKSLTPPSQNLSIKLPKVPAIKNTNIQKPSCLRIYIHTKNTIATILIPITKNAGTLIPQEIPVLKTWAVHIQSKPRHKS